MKTAKPLLCFVLLLAALVSSAQPSFKLLPSAVDPSGVYGGVWFDDEGYFCNVLYSTRKERELVQINVYTGKEVKRNLESVKHRKETELAFIGNNERIIRLTTIDLYAYKHPYVAFTLVPIPSLTRYDYDPRTLEPIGQPQDLKIKVERGYEVMGLRSPNGQWFATLGRNGYHPEAVTYTMYNNQGEVFTKDFTIAEFDRECKWLYEEFVTNNEGDALLSFVNDKSEIFLVHISADKKRLTVDKVDTKGKFLFSDGARMAFAPDGGAVYVSPTRDESVASVYSNGLHIRKYDANFKLLRESTIKYKEDIISAAPNRFEKFMSYLHAQKVSRLHFAANGGVIILSENNYTSFGAGYSVQRNALSFGFDEGLKPIYQWIIRAVQGTKENEYYCCNAVTSHIIGNNVYVIHRGMDINDKGTPKEWDMYCTYWEHDATKPKMIKVDRPSKELSVFSSNAGLYLGGNKFLFPCRKGEESVNAIIDLTE